MAVPSSPPPSGENPERSLICVEQMEVQMQDVPEPEIPRLEGPEKPDSELSKSAEARRGHENGKTCHQCRQKIKCLAVGCKNMKKEKQCTMKFCVNCLRNRYGEKAEDMEELDDWKCPKCRGICNCSQCMKRRGLKPTGILVYTARESGYSSVIEMMDAKGPEACQQLIVKKKTSTSAEIPVFSNKEGEENFLDGSSGSNLDSQPPASSADEMDGDDCVDPGAKKEVQKNKAKVKLLKLEASMNNDVVDVVLPTGTLLTSVSGMDLPSEDVGNALQFVEFCATFEEVLDIRKGQPESVLRDIMSERGGRKGKYSSAVQCIIQLLSFILKGEEESLSLSPDSDSDKDSWICSLKKIISESECVLEGIPMDCFNKGYDGYEMLEPSQKLKLLTFLCDEALCTVEMRNWIDEQHFKYVEKSKEARVAVNEAKDKERRLKLKLQKEAAKEVIAQNEDQAAEEVIAQIEYQAAKEIILLIEDQAAEEVIAENVDQAVMEIRSNGDQAVKELTAQIEDQAAKEIILPIEDQAAEEVIAENADQAVIEVSANGDQAAKELTAQIEDQAAKEIILRIEDQAAKESTTENADQAVMQISANGDQAAKELTSQIEDQAAEEIIVLIEDQAAKEVITENADQAVMEISANGDQVVNEVIAQNEDQDAKEVVAHNGDLQIINSEHDSILAEIRAELEQAREEKLKAMAVLPRKRRSDALRTQPIALDDKGRVYWRLNCLGESDLLLQDIGDPSYQLVSNEKWSSYNAAETKVIENHLSSLRFKRGRLDKLNDLFMMKNSNSDIEASSSSNDDAAPDATPTVNDN